MTLLEIETVRPRLEPFLRHLLERAGLQLKFRLAAGSPDPHDPSLASPDVVVEFSGPDTDLLLQRGGELLAALEYLSLRFLRLQPEERVRLAFDCQDYKSLRLEELRLTALIAAEKVARTGMPLALDPMEARDRRVIHFALKEYPSVRTESQGYGPHRKVVIFSAEKKSEPRP